MNVKAVARDVVIIFGLTFLSGFVVGLSGAQGKTYLLGITAGNLLFAVVGFAISGAIAKTDRFKHLFLVALGVWLLSLTNIVPVGATFAQWAASSILILVAMGLGGALSFLFVKSPNATNNAG